MISRRHLLKCACAACLIGAAIPRSVGGFGFAYTFHESPAPASAKSYNTLAFLDDFNTINTVDMANSKADGFNWYLDWNWPNSSQNWNGPNRITDSGLISVSNSVLTLASTTLSNGGTIMSAGYKASAPGYVGKVFDPSQGYYLEIKLAFNPALSPASCNVNDGTCGWPVIWNVGIDMLTGAATEFIEVDFFEAFPSGAGAVSKLFSVHDWTNATQNQVSISDTLGGADLSQFHTYGTRLTPTSANGGTGLIERYFDNAHITGTDVSYTLTTGSTPSASPSNPNGVMSLIESQHFPIFLGTGFNWPLSVDWVALWTP